MIALPVLGAITILDFAWVARRARREWSHSGDLSKSTALAINSLYALGVGLLALALVLRPWPIAMPLIAAILAGVTLVLVGLGFALLGARLFGSSTKLYGVETGGLVEGGIYQFSRNPQYAGLILVAIGAAVLARSGLGLAVAGLITAGLWLWVVGLEEPHLSRVFGSRYDRYCARVPRFFGLRHH